MLEQPICETVFQCFEPLFTRANKYFVTLECYVMPFQPTTYYRASANPGERIKHQVSFYRTSLYQSLYQFLRFLDGIQSIPAN